MNTIKVRAAGTNIVAKRPGDKAAAEMDAPARPERSSERVNLRVSSAVKTIISDAADEVGMTVNAFVVNCVLEKSNQILSERRIIKLDREARDRFLALLNNPDEPNEALRSAAKEFNEAWFDGSDYQFEE